MQPPPRPRVVVGAIRAGGEGRQNTALNPPSAPRCPNAATESTKGLVGGASFAAGRAYWRPLGFFLRKSAIHSEVTDFGRSRGRPSARSQNSWASTPYARPRPKRTCGGVGRWGERTCGGMGVGSK
eukprot:scaffold23796_cov144-Isochrysis_galbana.AAC.5